MGAIRVTIIRPGRSNNGRIYRPEVLREAARLFEGATAFADHRDGPRSVRDVVGVYRDVTVEPDGRVRGVLDFARSAEAVEQLVVGALEARSQGRPAPAIGVSIDAFASQRAVTEADGRRSWDVARVHRVNSVDVVFAPSAGGSFDERVMEGVADGAEREESVMETETELEFQRIVENDEGVGAGGTPVAEAAAPPAAPAPPPSPQGGQEAGQGQGSQRVVEQAELQRTLEQLNGFLSSQRAALLEVRLREAALPDGAATRLRQRFEGRAWEAAELDAALAEYRELLGFGASRVTGNGQARDGGLVGSMLTPLDRYQAGLDRLMGCTLTEQEQSAPRVRGIREAYTIATGDYEGRGEIDRAAVRIAEANEVTTAVIANALRNSMTKRLVQIYNAQPKWWAPVVSYADLADLKTQDRIRLNDFGALATVAENAAYQNVAWGDARETYAPVKKGNLVAVTLEAILNDDTHAIRQIPERLGQAAIVTINEYVANLFTSNPAMADTFTVYDAANHQSNLGSTALSASAVQAAVVVLLKMQNSASKRVGVRPRFLLVPPDLLFTALVIVGSTLATGTNNNDINPLQGSLEVVSVPQFTDVTDWYLQADPASMPGIEMGFLNGRREPELLTQDEPRTGLVFTNDQITYKIRWIFGGGWLDYRGAFRATVAG